MQCNHYATIKGTKTIYNDAFYTTEYTDEYGTKTEYTYDDHYRVLTEKTGDETTSYTYDSKGNGKVIREQRLLR